MLQKHFDEFMRVCYYAPDGSSLQIAALKGFEICKSPGECITVCKYASEGSEFETEAIDKTVGLATSFDECMHVYRTAPNGSDLQIAALRKAYSLIN